MQVIFRSFKLLLENSHCSYDLPGHKSKLRLASARGLLSCSGGIPEDTKDSDLFDIGVFPRLDWAQTFLKKQAAGLKLEHA